MGVKDEGNSRSWKIAFTAVTEIKEKRQTGNPRNEPGEFTFLFLKTYPNMGKD